MGTQNQRKTGRIVTDTRSRPTMNCGKSTTTRVVESGNAGDGVGDFCGEVIVAFLSPEASEEGHGCGPRGLGEDSHGRGEELLGVGHE